MMNKRILAACLLLSALAAGLWCVGRPLYRSCREQRAVEQARKFAEGNDWRSASLSARRALALNPRNIEANGMMAAMAERAGSPQALSWRQRMVELEPGLDNQLKLLAAAVVFEGPPWAVADRVLADISAAAGSRPDFHVLAAELALKRNDSAGAQGHFLQAIRLQPTNHLHQLNLAVLRLGSTNEETVQAGRLALEELAKEPEFAPLALRSLVAASVSRKRLAEAEAFSERLVGNPRCTWDDRLRHLEILKQGGSTSFQQYLKELEAGALTNAPALAVLCGWMNRNGLSGEAFACLTNAPARIQAQLAVRVALADCYSVRKDWVGLQTWLEAQKWDGADFLRHGYLARASFEQARYDRGESEWRLAILGTRDSLGALTDLRHLAGNSFPGAARNELLWRIAEKHPCELWACRELESACAEAGETRSLHRLYRLMSESDPSDRRVKNNLAGTSLLLGTALPQAHVLAKENYAGHETDPVYAATYAYSLHVQGQTRAGLQVLEQLRPEDLKGPAVALYYGVLLGADGQREKGAGYLSLAAGARLLPEEKALLAAGREPARN